MKITFFETPEHEQIILKDYLKDHEVVFTEDKLNEENFTLALDSEIISVFINSVMNKEILLSN
jgi:hypothetical protein